MKLLMGYLFVLTAHASFMSEMSVSAMTQQNRTSQTETTIEVQKMKPKLSQQIANLNDKKVNQLIKKAFTSTPDTQKLKKKMADLRDVLQKNKDQILNFRRADISDDIKRQLNNIKRNAQKRVDILNNIHNQ